MPPRMNITGQKFNLLTALECTEEKQRGCYLWKCKCDCGNYYITTATNIKRERVKSCGCLQNNHGLKNHPLYSVWKDMKRRCHNPRRRKYPVYGGRGIIVCDEWKDNFKTFYDWAMNNGYKKGLSIDRIDNDGNYEPSNCQWITVAENSRKAALERIKKGIQYIPEHCKETGNFMPKNNDVIL